MPTENDILLAEARLALHKIQLGGAVVEVTHGDQRIKYSEANVKNLEAYIARLEGLTSTTSRRAAFGVIF